MTAPRRGVLPSVVITWALLVGEYETWMRAVGRSPQTVELRAWQVRKLAGDIGGHPNAVTEDDLITWFGCFPDWKPETRHSYRSGVCMFFEWAWKFGRIVSNPAANLPVMRPGKAVPRPADESAWNEAMQAADLRTTLILRLAGQAGLRRAEIARVHTRDLIDGGGGAQLIVHGKGNKKRLVPLSEGLAELVRLGAPGHTPEAIPNSWLFPSGTGEHISPLWVGELARKVLPEGVTLHMLRHMFASKAYRGSRNLRAVQRLLGHASVSTTERYTAVDDDEMRAAAMAAALT